MSSKKLSIGIVGLPNVGKSTLFNAITMTSQAAAENFPFCTIEPNIGIVPIPDPRLQVLSTLSQSRTVIPAVVEFVDIAGLVKGASQGEGLGNKFLSHIREVSAIAHVVRCFDDDNVTHVDGQPDPIRDINTINLELIMADLQTTESLILSHGKKDQLDRLDTLKKIAAHLETESPIRKLDLSKAECDCIRDIHFLTQKNTIYVANIQEDEIGQPNQYVDAMAEFADRHGDKCVVISAKIEHELAALSGEEKTDYLQSIGLHESGLNQLVTACFSLLRLQTFLTAGPKETRAWTIKIGTKAPQAAGVIHTDFETGFIRANIVSFDDFVASNGLKSAKEAGRLRQEGKEYVMQEGDVVEFLFNT